MKKILFTFFAFVFTLFLTTAPFNAHAGKSEVATFAGGCFWCVESTFEKLPGVRKVVSGYTGGKTRNPTYDQVSRGKTGHTEAVQIYYNPDKISYDELLYHFWKEIDPTDADGQFADRGSPYRPAIFYETEQEKNEAIASKQALEESGRFKQPVVVEILPAEKFYKAESYHQNYYKTNPFRYKLYRSGSGRDRFLKRTWGDDLHKPYKKPSNTAKLVDPSTPDSEKYTKPDEKTLKKMLSRIQYKVTQKDGTERPYRNKYWDNKKQGIYVDVVSKEPLFSSTTKFKSGTGWPSFSNPIDDRYIVEKSDNSLFAERTEVRSRYGDSHLGHVFTDGPNPTGLRYCINSAALEFIPVDKLKEKGYGEYMSLFQDT